MKYKRYVPAYRKELRYRQTTVDVAFVSGYFAALDRWRATGKKQVIFGGWGLSSPDVDEN